MLTKKCFGLDFFYMYILFPFLGLPEQDNLVKDLKNKLKQETQENAKLNNEMTKKDTIINQLKEKLQIADCQKTNSEMTKSSGNYSTN